MNTRRNFKPHTDRKINLSPSPLKRGIQRNFAATDPKRTIEQLKKHFQNQTPSNTPNSTIQPWNKKDKEKHAFQQRLQTRKVQLSSNYRQQYEILFQTQKNQQQKLDLRYRLKDFQNDCSQSFLSPKDQIILLRVKQMQQMKPTAMAQFLKDNERQIFNLQIQETRFEQLTQMNKSIQNSNINDNYLNQIKNRKKKIYQQQQILILETAQLEKEQFSFENRIKELILTDVSRVDKVDQVNNQKQENLNFSLLSSEYQSYSCSQSSIDKGKQSDDLLAELNNQKSSSKENCSILRLQKEKPKKKNKKLAYCNGIY